MRGWAQDGGSQSTLHECLGLPAPKYRVPAQRTSLGPGACCGRSEEVGEWSVTQKQLHRQQMVTAASQMGCFVVFLNM